MTPTTRRLIVSWLTGALVGTGVIATTSPWFIRSYLPLHADATRGVWTLPPDQWYRWRSEGYADTRVGPLGMPGKQSIPARQADEIRVALWGDSQAEGVCVSDQEKLFAQAEAISDGRLQIFPLARSGEDAADWLTQMPAVEQALDLDAHVLLVVDVQDLMTATQAPLPPPSESDVAAARAAIAAKLPAFVIQAARHLLTEADETTPRRLRFSIGPLKEVEDAVDGRAESGETPSAAETEFVAAPVHPSETWQSDTWQSETGQTASWRREMEAIRSASSLPILILYAPVVPQIVHGRVVTQNEDRTAAEPMQETAAQAGLHVANAQDRLLRSAREGRWPHGFDNGYIGSGHLNDVGNAVVGSVLVDAVLDQLAGHGDVGPRTNVERRPYIEPGEIEPGDIELAEGN